MNNDLISREALKNIAYINKGNFNTVEGIRKWIDNAPTVEPNQDAEHDATQYSTGYQDGFLEAKKLFTDPENAAALEKITAEIVSILKDVMPQVVEIAKADAMGNGMKEGQTDE